MLIDTGYARSFDRSENTMPILALAGVVAVTLLWNAWLGIAWRPSLCYLSLGPTMCFAVAMFYTRARPNRPVAEIFLYLGLWSTASVFGVRLSYQTATIGNPYQDWLLRTVDDALGFSWIDWALFIYAHPLVERVQQIAYASHLWQPIASIVIFAVFGPAGRNRELFLAMTIAMLMTMLIAAVMPAVGPAGSYGIPTEPATIMQQLRDGMTGPFGYAGIIWFPSLHTAMAVLFTLAHRDNRFFPIFFAINLIMLTAVPYTGNHYLADMIGGILIALAAFRIARTAR